MKDIEKEVNGGTLSIKEACKMLKISRYQLMQEVKSGKMRFKPTGKRIKFTIEVLEEWRNNTINLLEFSKERKRITPTSQFRRKADSVSYLEKLREQLTQQKQPSTA